MKRLTNVLIIALTAFCFQTLYAETWTIYDSHSGFDNVMTSFSEDNNGNYWIGSVNSGIYKFDGTTWTKVSPDIEDEEIKGIIYSKGTIWAASNNGLIKITIGNISAKETLKFNDNISQNSFTAVALDSAGAIWVGGGDVEETILLTTNGNDWNQIGCGALSAQSFIPAIKVDSENRIWFISDAGLSEFKGTTFKSYNHSNSSLPAASLTCLEIDKTGKLWIGTFGSGVYSFDGNEFKSFTNENSILPMGVMVNGIAVDKDNIIWLGTQNTGVFKFDGNVWTSVSKTNSQLPSNFIQTVAIDRKNRKLFSTMDKGLAILDDNITDGIATESPCENLIFPNPASDFINIQTPKVLKTSEIYKVQIFDMLGKEIKNLNSALSLNGGRARFDISDLQTGVYYIRIGDRIEKFVKM